MILRSDMRAKSVCGGGGAHERATYYSTELFSTHQVGLCVCCSTRPRHVISLRICALKKLTVPGTFLGVHNALDKQPVPLCSCRKEA